MAVSKIIKSDIWRGCGLTTW